MTSPTDEDPDLARILERVRRSQGFDGRLYKPNYIKRRLAVRMRSVGASTLREYLRVLERDPAEAGALQKRLTIHVTEFFRDPEVYQALEKKFLPQIEKESDLSRGDRILRSWCAGCSTGEEPYSLALTMADWTGQRSGWDFNILATDIDEASVQTAVRGEYPEAAFIRMSPGQRDRGFAAEDQRFRVLETLKCRVRFKVHDLLSPWPVAWTGFDVIFCRNLLIYLRAAQQQQLYLWFHGALNPGRFLVLGRTEALLGRARRYFECVDIPNRIYRALPVPGGPGSAWDDGENVNDHGGSSGG